MKLPQFAALAVLAALATSASAANFTVDFEKTWSYGSYVNDYYAGGTADDGSAGANLGVSFTGVSGLSNEAGFTYYAGAPSMQGVAYAYSFEGSTAFMNVAAGVDGALSFYYLSPTDAVGAIKAYSGLNGSGTLLGTFDLAANNFGEVNDTWTAKTFSFTGIAKSFDLTGSANVVAFDNISAVPEPTSIMLMLAGGAALLGLRGRRRQD